MKLEGILKAFALCCVCAVGKEIHITEVERNTSNRCGLKTQVVCRNIRNQWFENRIGKQKLVNSHGFVVLWPRRKQHCLHNWAQLPLKGHGKASLLHIFKFQRLTLTCMDWAVPLQAIPNSQPTQIKCTSTFSWELHQTFNLFPFLLNASPLPQPARQQ